MVRRDGGENVEAWHGAIQNETIAIFLRRNLDGTVLILEQFDLTLPEGNSLCVRLVKRYSHVCVGGYGAAFGPVR